MSDAPGTETFEFDMDFLGRYTFFLNKYASDHANCSVVELVKDLQQYFGCIAAALIRYKSGTETTVTLCYPSNEQNTIGWVLEQSETDKRIRDLLGVERYGGDSFCLEIPPAGKGKSGTREVDLILMPRLADSEMRTDYAQLFILVDPMCLMPAVNHRAERDWQRTMIAQFLCGWWIRVTVPKFGLAQPTSYLTQDDRFTTLLANRMYIAAPSTLIGEGIRSAETVRRYWKSENIYFQGEIEGGTFDWGKWTPLFRPGRESLKRARAKEELLVYWCRWVGSHHDLEREQTAPASESLTEKTSHSPVADWVKKQRREISFINRRLEELRDMAANEFLAGRTESTTKASEEENQEKLPIGPKSLLCFSLNSWLAPDGRLRTDLGSGVLSDIEFCRTLHGVAITAHYLLAEQGLTDDVIHRLTQLIAQYGHGDLGIPARLDLRAHLLQAARGEPALHALKRFYRDHFFHTLEVCFLGHALLETELDENRRLWQLVAEHLHVPENKQQVLRLWYMATLLHDIGYAMDVLNGSRKFLGFFKHSTALRTLDRSFEEALMRLFDAEEVGKLGIKMDRGIEQDHGVIGALHLRSLLDRIAQDDQTVIPDDYMPAIQAIALHNLRRHDDKISFTRQPLAFLLAICDQLQEWRRPQLSFATSPNWLLARLGGASAESAGLEGAFKSMNANLNILSGNAGNINLRFRTNAAGNPTLAFTMEYDEQINRNSGVFSVWLDATLNFQRLDFEGLPLDISVTYITPLYENHVCKVPQPQLYRLRNAAHETHMSFLMEWFPTRQDATNKTFLTNGAVTYSHSDNREELTLDLRPLSSKVLVTRGMDAFWKCLQEWKNFDDDRDFPGDYVSVTPE
jgi:hypothetical protein